MLRACRVPHTMPHAVCMACRVPLYVGACVSVRVSAVCCLLFGLHVDLGVRSSIDTKPMCRSHIQVTCSQPHPHHTHIHVNSSQQSHTHVAHHATSHSSMGRDRIILFSSYVSLTLFILYYVYDVHVRVLSRLSLSSLSLSLCLPSPPRFPSGRCLSCCALDLMCSSCVVEFGDVLGGTGRRSLPFSLRRVV